MDKQWLSPQEAADYLSVSRQTIYRWARTNKIKFHKVGGVTRVKKEDLDKLFESS